MAIFLKNHLYDIGYYFCFPLVSNDNYRIAYEMYLVVVFIALPLVIQCAAYFDVIRELRGIKMRFSHTAHKEKASQTALDKRSIFSGYLMLAFQVCYLPRGVIMVMQEFTPETTSKPEFLYVELITLAMYYLKYVINPFILWA